MHVPLYLHVPTASAGDWDGQSEKQIFFLSQTRNPERSQAGQGSPSGFDLGTSEVMRRLEVSNRASAVSTAFRLGLLP